MISKEKTQEYFDKWYTIAEIAREFPNYSYRRVYRHIRSLWVDAWVATENYKKKRTKYLNNSIEEAFKMLKEWKSVKYAAEKLWLSYNTLVWNLRTKTKKLWMRIYNWRVVDYWDQTRDCLDCRKRTSLYKRRCPECQDLFNAR